MPELAEVEFYRRRWAVGHGGRITAVHVHPEARIFRDCDPAIIVRELTGRKLVGSAAAAKQMHFRLTGGRWLGLHLGMSGELRVESADYVVQRHDHLVLRQSLRTLVFTDPRMFGGVRWHLGPRPPLWWTQLAPAVLSTAFTTKCVDHFLRRHARAPIKTVLLQQEQFPGIGNWMADEILWRAEIHPGRLTGSLTAAERHVLRRECRWVCRAALRVIAGVGGMLPADLNANIPAQWLFIHRWKKGGTCPRSGVTLRHSVIGGRTTCWSPARQKF